MKNLKKVLALALALVMTFGMMTTAFAAEDKITSKDLKDMDTVTNKAEVALLVDLGVINGFEDSTYRPTETVTRAQMAKMVFYVLMGDVDASVYAGNSRFKDVAGTWSEGYVNYLATAGVEVVAGDDAGNFNPNATVRVAEAAKMLMVAAGWDAEDRSYMGSGWSGAVMRDANKRGLMDGVNQTALQPMTRDNAAKMIFNGLNLGVVEAIRKQTFVGTGVEKLVDSYESMGYSLGYNAFGMVKVTGLVKEIDDKGKVVFKGDTSPVFTVKVPGDATMVGQNVEFYVKTKGATFTVDARDVGKVTMATAGTLDKLISATPVAGGVKVLKTVTDGVDWTKCFVAPGEGKKADAKFVAEKETNVSYYANGKYGTLPTSGESKSGEVVEFCDLDDNGKVDLVRAYEWKVAVVGDDGVKTTTKKDVTYVTVAGVVDTADTPAANVKGAEGLVAGDIVLYYATGAAKTDTTVIEKAETVTGNVTGKNNKSGALTIGGKAYAKSGIWKADLDDMFANWANDTKTENYIWALDKNGDICYYTAPAGATVETKTALVLATGFAAGSEAGGLVGSTATADKANAQLLYTDGTVEVVDVVKVGDKVLNDKDSSKKMAASDLPAKGSVVKYSSNDKKEFTLTVDNAAAGVAENSVIAAKSNFTGSLRADSNTLFIVGKGTEDDGYKYTTYTGYTKLPGFTTKGTGKVLYKDGVVTVAFLTTDAFEGDAPAGYIYVADIANYDTVAGQSYVELTTVGVDGVEAKAKFAEVPTEVGFYKIKKVDENGVITQLDTKATTVAVATGDVKMAGGIFTVESSTYEYDDKTKVIIIELSKDGDTVTYTSVGVVKAGDIKNANGLEILVNGEAEKLVDTIYVLRTTNAE